jgi:superfamily II DNA or RNA helicase
VSQISLFEKPAIAPSISVPKVAAVPDAPKRPKELRPYQRKLVDGVYERIRNNIKKILIIGTGGLGKTLIAAWIMRDCSVRSKNKLRSVFLVERNCLLEQTYNTLQDLGVGCSIIQGSRKVKWDQPCMVASLQTITSWLESGKDVRKLLGKVGLFVLDEAHDGVGQKSYQDLQDSYSPTGTVFLGLTASPWRTKKDEYLGKWFDDTVTTIQPPEAIKLGWLAGAHHKACDGVLDREKLETDESGDFSDSQMAKQAMRPEAMQHVVDQYLEFGGGQPAIAFCSTVAQIKAQSKVFNANGIASDWQSGSTARGKRKDQDEALNNGSLKVLCTVGTLTKGYDNPCVGCVIFLRATKSKSLFFQAAWRGCRPFKGSQWLPKKDYFRILDFGGNLELHGNPMGYQDYDISEPRSLKKDKQPTPTKICFKCNAVINQFLKVCPHCDAEFVGKDDQQELFNPAQYQLKDWLDPLVCEQLQFVRSLKREYFVRKINPDNVAKEFAKEFGFQPPLDWHLWAVSGRGANKGDREKYFEYLKPFAPHDYWIKRHMKLEFGDAKGIPKFLANWKEQWWEVLGVDRTASREQVKAVYLSAAKQWHPDINLDHAESTIQMQILNLAWEKYNASNAV